MNSVQPAVGDRVLEDLIANGGGTYDAVTLAGVKPTEGYAIGLGGDDLTLEHFVALEAEGRESILRGAAERYGSNFVGTWLRSSDNRVYVDAVAIIADPQTAWQMAVRLNQQEVFDFGAGRSIRPGQITFDQ